MDKTIKTTKELKILLQGPDWAFTQKFTCAEDFNLSRNDPIVEELFRKANSCVNLSPDREEFRCKIMKR